MNKFQKLACSYAKTQMDKGVENHGFVAVKNMMYSHMKKRNWPYRKCVDFNRWNRAIYGI